MQQKIESMLNTTLTDKEFTEFYKQWNACCLYPGLYEDKETKEIYIALMKKWIEEYRQNNRRLKQC